MLHISVIALARIDDFKQLKLFMQSAVSLLHSNIFIQVIKWGSYSGVTFQLCTVLRTIERFNCNERERAGLISTH